MYRSRIELEQFELDTLAPYATMSRYSRGRKHRESEPEYRTAFQRDRDRVVHSAAFRRLEYKTQVFVNDAGDYYRTRLTHTLEVAQVGRSIARALGVNEDLVEVVCLAHDLGHPPFGHAGEHVIDELVREYGGFNHNHQSYRVVNELEQRYPNWKGLNLTFESLEGIAKHETEYDLSVIAGFEYEMQGSLEAQIANIADELAYNAHDLDDGLQSGLIVVDQLQELEIWRELCDRLEWSGHRLSEVDRHRFIREQIGMQIDDVLSTTMDAIGQLQPQSLHDVQRHTQQLVRHSETMVKRNKELKTFLFQNMYYHPSIARMSKRAQRFITEIFTNYVDEPKQLPLYYQAQIDKEGVHRVVADYIASMTDRAAIIEYSRFVDPLTRL